MKKQLLAFVLLLTSLNSFSQTEKGNLLLGGGFSFTSSKEKLNAGYVSPYKRNYININPRIGYFIANNFAIGLNIGFENTATTYTSNPARKTSSPMFYAGPFVRYYKMLGDKFALFGQGQFNFRKGTQQDPAYDFNTSPAQLISHKYKLSGFDFDVMPGLVYFPTKKIGIEITLGSFGYSHFVKEKTFDDNSKDSDNNINFGINFSRLSLGLMFYL